MANATIIHLEQPIVIECGNPTELIFTVTDAPESGIGGYQPEFKLRSAYAPAGELIETIDGEPNKGVDGVDAEGKVRVVVDSDVTKDLDAGGHYRWDLWRTEASPPRLLAKGTCTIRRTVRFPADS